MIFVCILSVCMYSPLNLFGYWTLNKHSYYYYYYYDMWTDPAGRWTDKTAGRPQSGKSVHPTNKDYGSG